MNLTPSMYKQRLQRSGLFAGQSKKNQADIIAETSWYEDLATRTCYFYDYFHDNEPLKLNDLHPDKKLQVPLDVKYIVYSSQTYSKDAVTYHIQFKPSQEGHSELVSYYDECFKNRYNATFPVGLYVAIPDAKGVYNRWLVVDKANYNDPQYPTYEVLRCGYVLDWIFKGIKYRYPCVLRSQNSYNSGVWEDHFAEIVEDQQKAILPLNRETENLYYNQRMIIDNNILTEPRAWRISKVNRITPNGNIMLTFAQDQYDPHLDYVEIDEETGEFLGKWANYYGNGEVEPQYPSEPDTQVYCEVTTPGKPTIKMNDTYKKFTVNFYKQGEEIEFKEGEWSFAIKETESGTVIKLDDPTVLLQIKYYGDAKDINENQIKVKYIGDMEYYNWILIVTYTETEDDKNISSSIEVNITRL